MSFIVFRRVVYFMKRIYHFSCKFGIVNFFQDIFNPRFIMIKIHCRFRFICCFYVTFNSQGHIATGSLQVEETSAYCTLNHRASASNYQLSNMKRPARDSNRRPQRLEARTLTATPPSPLRYTVVNYNWL